jgi:glucose-1-phosphate cytidylyltransferase
LNSGHWISAGDHIYKAGIQKTISYIKAKRNDSGQNGIKGAKKMKVVLLAGGYGTRLSEESHLRPKPMIEIGEQPILWHIMKLYSFYGFYDFIICAGYKQHMIKEYFADYYLHRCDVTFDFSQNGVMCVHNSISEPWRVTIVNTGRRR